MIGMGTSERYSIWTIPSGVAYSQTQEIISYLSNKGHEFEPHVTLIGNFCTNREQAINALQAISRGITPFEIQLVSVEYTATPDLIIRAATTPELSAVFAMVMGALAPVRHEVPGPHLSLHYGPVSAEKLSLAIHSAQAFLPLTFKVEVLYLCSTEGKAGQWTIVSSTAIAEGLTK